MRRWLVAALFFLSGATALAYQVSWTRHLVLLFGNTTHAISLILAAYMLGLALGSEAGGRLADRSPRPAVLYAVAEAAIGAYALAFPALVGGARAVYLSLGTGAAPVLFGGAFLLLLVPTFLMGATLPLLVRATVLDPGRTGGTVGWLYGINIVGAVAGTCLTGFWLLEAAGILGASVCAAVVNLLIGVVGWAGLRHAGNPGLAARDEAAGTAPRAAATPAQKAALVAVGLGGFVGLAAEVAWTRLLVFFLQGFTYTFSAMLATFLAGLAIGGFVFGRVARTSPRPEVWLGRLQVAVGVLSAGVLLLLTAHREVTHALWNWADTVTGHESLRGQHVLTLLSASALILLPPAVAMGGVFPLAAAAYQRGLGDLGARVGRLYAVNTVGAVLGAVAAGFVLAPLVGMTWTAVAVSAVSLASGAAVLCVGRAPTPGRWTWPAAGSVAAVVLLVAADPTVPFILRSHVFAGSRGRENRLIETHEGTVCQVSVVRNDREDYELLYTDEFEAAGTKPEYRYMRMLAHLPVALVEDPSRVLVICFGTGTTSGSVSTHDAVRELDIVEISPQVLSVADRFTRFNRGVLRGAGREDLAVRAHVDDGRNYVLRSDATWDVLTLEPLMPYTPAAIHFYTEDFYRECAPRLSEGGLMCQWIPLQGMSGEHFRQLVRAFVDVFPDSGLFFVDGAVALVGGNVPVELRYARVAERLAAPRVRADLAEVGYDDPVRALGTFVAGGEALREFVADVEPVTDEHPVLEFHPLPLGVAVKHLFENLVHMETLRTAQVRLPVDLAGAADPDRTEDRLRGELQVGNLLLRGMVSLEAAGLLTRNREPEKAGAALSAAKSDFELAYGLDPENETAARHHHALERMWNHRLARAALDQGDLDQAQRLLRRALEHRALRRADEAWSLLAEVRNRGERFEDALAAALESTARHPRGAEGLGERAYARAALGDLAGARDDYLRATQGGTVEDLPTRLRSDAERVLASADTVTTLDPAEAIRRALDGETRGRIPARLWLRIVAQEHPEVFAAHFASDLEVAADGSSPEAAREESFRRLAAAAVEDAPAVALAAAADPSTPRRVRVAAASLLAGMDADRFVALLDAALDDPARADIVPLAAQVADHRVVDRLLRWLDSGLESLRVAAHRASFSLLGSRAPRLGVLDPTSWPDRDYRDGVHDVQAWWARNRDATDL